MDGHEKRHKVLTSQLELQTEALREVRVSHHCRLRHGEKSGLVIVSVKPEAEMRDSIHTLNLVVRLVQECFGRAVFATGSIDETQTHHGPTCASLPDEQL